jgi:diaminopimelate decarboxylase
MLQWGHALEACSGRSVRFLDMGGGWAPSDWGQATDGLLGDMIAEARKVFTQLDHVAFEPGKALSESTSVLAVTVLQVRTDGDGVLEAVVDGSVAECPEARAIPHRVMARDSEHEGWRPLAPGAGRILGRLCMENDILADDVELTEDIRPGDVLLIWDSGAYDRSMSYVFGRG